MKRQYEKLLTDASVHPTLSKVTLRDLIQECCWARNTTLTISGYTPVELATEEDQQITADLELMKPACRGTSTLNALNELKKLALRAHLEEARFSQQTFDVMWLDESFLLMDLTLMETESLLD